MRKLVLTLETVTPLFLGGAEQHPELRPASVRGALRFWLRAALGGVIGDNDLDRLRRLEAEVFGETERGSAVAVRMSGRETSQPFNPDSGLVGLRYLLFSMHRLKRFCVPAGSPFTVTLQVRAGHQAALHHAAAAMWLLARLGSLGARSRRGAGSLNVTDAEGWLDGLPAPIVRPATIEDLKSELAGGLRQIRANVEAWTRITPPATMSEPEFDVLHPDACQLYLLRETWGTWEEAMEHIGNAFLSFRTSVSGLPSAKRAIFGLPLPFYYRDERKTYTISPASTDRRASPLAIRLVKLAGGGGYAVLLIVFRSKFLPPTERLRVSGGGDLHDVPPTYSVLDEFISTLGMLEVNYR